MDDDEATQRLQCDMELQFTGPDDATVNKRAADMLRKLADRIEKDEYGTGWHDIKGDDGRLVGKLYLDHSEEYGMTPPEGTRLS
ncbi:MAG TPA: hypothetical protein VGU45_01170 [Microvirga sp.]|jgi:hypothetical protein|nr:hypothetical protein [Microvirga sp.]